MTYNEFKTAAYRYRYEAAIETEDERISYGELLERVNALYNSFCQMGAPGKTVAVLTGNCPETVYAILACLKAGCRCVLCRVSGPKSALSQKLAVYRPSVAVIHACNFVHSADILAKSGCNCAVFVGRAEADMSLLPSVHFMTDLLEINDYSSMIAPQSEGSVVLANDGVHFDTKDAISSLGRRDGVFVGLPLYCGAGYDSLVFSLLSGHKCVLSAAPTKQFFKKKNVKLALVYKGVDVFDTDALFYENDNTFCINGEFVYPEECKNLISEAIGYPVFPEYDGKKLKITVKLFENDDIDAVSKSPLARAVAREAGDVLYGVPCPKTVVFKK